MGSIRMQSFCLNISAASEAFCLSARALYTRYTLASPRFLRPKAVDHAPKIAKPGSLPVQYFCFLNSELCSYSFSHLPKWRNWQTRMVQVHVPARVWGFESLLRHHF